MQAINEINEEVLESQYIADFELFILFETAIRAERPVEELENFFYESYADFAKYARYWMVDFDYISFAINTLKLANVKAIYNLIRPFCTTFTDEHLDFTQELLDDMTEEGIEPEETLAELRAIREYIIYSVDQMNDEDE